MHFQPSQCIIVYPNHITVSWFITTKSRFTYFPMYSKTCVTRCLFNPIHLLFLVLLKHYVIWHPVYSAIKKIISLMETLSESSFLSPNISLYHSIHAQIILVYYNLFPNIWLYRKSSHLSYCITVFTPITAFCLVLLRKSHCILFCPIMDVRGVL